MSFALVRECGRDRSPGTAPDGLTQVVVRIEEHRRRMAVLLHTLDGLAAALPPHDSAAPVPATLGVAATLAALAQRLHEDDSRMRDLVRSVEATRRPAER